MKPLHLAILGAVLAVVAVLVLMQDSDDTRRRTRADTDSSRSRTETGPDSTAGEDSPGGTGSEDADGVLSVVVKVVDGKGVAVADAELALTGARTRNDRTDEQGGGRFAALAPGFYDLRASKGAAVAAQSFELTANTDLGTLALLESVVLRGHVYDGKGAPLRGARVEAVAAETLSGIDFSRIIELWVRPDAVVGATETDETGRFEVRVPKGKGVALRVMAKGFAQEGEPARAYNSDVDGLDFHLMPGATVAGVVVDPEGRPIAGARVMVTNPESIFGRRLAKVEAISAPDGSFQLATTPAQQLMLIVRAVGYALHMDQLKLPAIDLRITLEPGVKLLLRAVDEDEPHPARGVDVLVNYKGGFASGRTDDRGELVIEHLPTSASTMMGRQQQAFLMGGGYVPKLVSLQSKVPVDGVLDLGEVKLKSGGTIRGRVLDARSNEPVAGARVRTFGGLDMQLQFIGSIPAVSADDGSFELTGVPLGATMLLANHPDYVSDLDPMAFGMASSGKALFADGKTELERDIALTPAAVLTGVVLDPRGEPISGATVTIQQSGQLAMMSRLLGGGIPEAVSGAEGAFALHGLKEGIAVKLVASHRQFGSSEARSVTPGTGDTVQLTLTEPIQIKGVVVDASLQPVEGVRVTVTRKSSPTPGNNRFGPMQSDQGAARPAVSDGKGEYLVRDAPSGDLVVTLDHPSYTPASVEVSVAPGSPVRELARVVLDRGHGIEGLVVDEAGAPVGGVAVNVSVNMTGAMNAVDTSGEGRSFANEVTAADGTFAVYGLKKGEYMVQPFRQGSYGEQKTVATGTKALRLLVRPAARFKGRVHANGRPVANANVRVEPDGEQGAGPRAFGRGMGWARTDAAGEFTISPLPPEGTFTVVIDHDGYATRRVPNMTAGDAVRDFTLDAGVRVGGVVVDNKNVPVPNAAISIRAGKDVKTVRTDPNGAWTAGGLGDGPITIVIADWSGFVRQDPIPVAPGDMNLRIVVERGMAISGSVVGGKNEALRGLRVEAVDENGETASTTWIWADQRAFRLNGLRRGKYTLRVSRFEENKWKVLAAAEAVASGATDVELALE